MDYDEEKRGKTYGNVKKTYESQLAFYFTFNWITKWPEFLERLLIGFALLLFVYPQHIHTTPMVNYILTGYHV